MEPISTSPRDAYERIAAGKALLVCAYPDADTCSKMQLQNAITRSELQARLPELRKDQEIILYCA